MRFRSSKIIEEDEENQKEETHSKAEIPKVFKKEEDQEGDILPIIVNMADNTRTLKDLAITSHYG